MSFPALDGHRAHDVALLLRRWRELAERADLNWRRIATAGGHGVFCASAKSLAVDEANLLYLSAGVHGDEAAPPWALLEWAGQNIAQLRSLPVVIFPCLNPDGIRHNTRVDQRGVDINRTFNSTRDPLIRAWRAALGKRRPALALCLHEDYDAQGCYVYELTQEADTIGEAGLRACAGIIAPDARGKIDGRVMKNGLFVRRGDFAPPDLPGLPEAIMLHRLGSRRTLTFETPSEFSLVDRIAAQRRFIETTARHVFGF
jgi:hypothetical protein